MDYAHWVASGATIAALILTINLTSIFWTAIFAANEANGDNTPITRAFGIMLLSAPPAFYIMFGIGSDTSLGSLLPPICGITLLVFNLTESISSIHRFNSAAKRFTMWRHWLDGDTHLKYHLVFRAAYRYNHFRWAVQFSFIVIPIWLKSKVDQGGPLASNPDAIKQFFTGLAVSIPLAVLAEPIYRWLYSGDKLIGECFRLRFMDTPFRATADSTKVHRWRSQRHRSSFMVSRVIETCVRSMRNRLCEDDFNRVAHAYSGVALKLQQRSFYRHDNDQPINEALIWACAALVVNDNPVLAAKRVAKVTQVADVSVPKYYESKYRRALDAVNATIESHRLILAFSALVALISYYVASGDTEALIKFAKSKLGGS